MAIILKENTALNNLVEELENKINEVNVEKKYLEDKKSLLQQKATFITKMHKKFVFKMFNKKFGYIFLFSLVFCAIWLAVMSRMTGGLLNDDWVQHGIACGVLIGVAYISTSLVYWSVMKKRVTSEAAKQTVQEFEQLKRDIREAEERRKNVVQELISHSAEISGNDGEQLVVKYLTQNFNDDFYVLNDVNVKSGKRKVQIDHIIVCKRGIFCLETKNFSIPYWQENETSWAFYKGAARSEKIIVKSPQLQSKYHVSVLASRLNDNAVLFPLVVLSNERGVFHGQGDDCPVIHAKQLKKIIKSYPQRYSEAQVKELAYQILSVAE